MAKTTMNTFYRTRLCKSLYSEDSNCIGGKCTYAHADEDLRCGYGKNCTNKSCSRIHVAFKFTKGVTTPSPKRIITTKTVKYVTITTSELPNNITETSFKAIKETPTVTPSKKITTQCQFYKTQMCHNLSTCKFGKKCNYAHSKKELKSLPPCHYGTKCFNKDTCHFNHDGGSTKAPWPEVEVDPNRTTPICIKPPALKSRILDYTDSEQELDEINFFSDDIEEGGVEEMKESGEPEEPEPKIDFTLEALLDLDIKEQERLLNEYKIIWKKENDRLGWGDQSEYSEPWKSLDELIIA